MGRSKPWTHIKGKKGFANSRAKKASVNFATPPSPFRSLLQRKGSSSVVLQQEGTTGVESVVLRDNDVVLGRGPAICSFQGNLQYRVFVCQYKHKYWSAKKLDKQVYIGKVVEAVRSLEPPGRFLEMTGNDLKLVDSEERIYEKISQALRDKKNCDPRSFSKQYGDLVHSKAVDGDGLDEGLPDPADAPAKGPAFPRRAKQGTAKRTAAGEAAKKAGKPRELALSSRGRYGRAKRSAWPPPMTEKEAENKRKGTGASAGTKVVKKSKTEGKEEAKEKVKVLRIKIRCAGWSAVHGHEEEPPWDDLDEDDSIEEPAPDAAETEASEDEEWCMTGDEVMNDENIWSAQGMFELLRFPTEVAADFGVSNDFLNLEADEIVPANYPPLLSGPVLIETVSLAFSERLGQEDPDEASTQGMEKPKKASDRLLSEWAEESSPGALDAIDSAGLAQVFSSAFEAEVASMASNGEGGGASKAPAKDATSGNLVSGDDNAKDPTNDLPYPHAMKVLVEGNHKNNSLAATLSLFDIAFKDRAEALGAAKKLLATM
jgi:hypothetical protein